MHSRCATYHDVDDLASEAFIGLMDAARRYQPKYGSFPNFARLRIHGHLIDFLRNDSWLPRKVMQEIKEGTHEAVKVNNFTHFSANGKPYDVSTYQHKQPLDDVDEVEHFCTQMKPDSGSLMRRYYGEGMLIRDIASQDGVCEAAVSLRIARLRRYLEQQRRRQPWE